MISQHLLLSIIICTQSRNHQLKALLTQLVRQITQSVSNKIEVLLVLSNSTQEVDRIAHTFNAILPNLVLIREERQGLSCARNSGVVNSRGAYLAFLDDDIILSGNYISELVCSINRYYELGFGGRVLPRLPSMMPKWFQTKGAFRIHGGGAITHYDLGSSAKLIDTKSLPPVGCNMIYKREAFQKYGLFRVNFGMSGNTIIYGDDSDFGWRLLMDNNPLRYLPNVCIFHPIPQHRVTLDYLKKSYYALGVYYGCKRTIDSGCDSCISCDYILHHCLISLKYFIMNMLGKLLLFDSFRAYFLLEKEFYKGVLVGTTESLDNRVRQIPTIDCWFNGSHSEEQNMQMYNYR